MHWKINAEGTQTSTCGRFIIRQDKTSRWGFVMVDMKTGHKTEGATIQTLKRIAINIKNGR